MYFKIAKVDKATGENFVRAKSPSVRLISSDTILNLLAMDLTALHLMCLLQISFLKNQLKLVSTCFTS